MLYRGGFHVLGEHTGGTGEVPLCLRQEEKVLDGLILRWSCSVIEALSTCGKKVRGGGGPQREGVSGWRIHRRDSESRSPSDAQLPFVTSEGHGVEPATGGCAQGRDQAGTTHPAACLLPSIRVWRYLGSMAGRGSAPEPRCPESYAGLYHLGRVIAHPAGLAPASPELADAV